MQCPLCKIEAAIANSRYVVVGDKALDTETKLYIEQEMTCRNPNCTNYKSVIATVRNELQLSKDTLETSEEEEVTTEETAVENTGESTEESVEEITEEIVEDEIEEAVVETEGNTETSEQTDSE